jgi:hypothetical protein
MDRRWVSLDIAVITAASVLASALASCGGDGGDTTPPSVSPWGTAQLIESQAGSAGAPQIGMDASGSAIAVWTQSDGSAGRTDIWANHFSAGSGTWGIAQSIGNQAGSAGSPQIVAHASGNAIVVWRQSNGSVDSGDIWANRFTAASGTWATAQLIESQAGTASSPQIAVDASGNAVAVWGQYDRLGNRYDISANRFSAASGTWGTAQFIGRAGSVFDAVGIPTSTSPSPSIGVDASGNAIVVWRLVDALAYDISANRFNAASGTWGTAQLIESQGDSVGPPRVAIDASGNAIAVWNQSILGLQANRYSATSGTWGTAQSIGHGASGLFSPSIAMDASGNAVVAWREDDARFQTHVISVNRFTIVSGTWGTAQTIGGAGRAFDPPSIAVDTSGNAIAVWPQLGFLNRDIWARRFSAASGAWGAAQIIESQAGDAVSSRVAVHGNGNAIAVWQQFDGTRFNIWANHFSAASGN